MLLPNKKAKIKRFLHLSTQGASFGQGGLEELREAGISRAILPRKVSADEILQLRQSSLLELEFLFMERCRYSISGGVSEHFAWKSSGNRGFQYATLPERVFSMRFCEL